MRYWTTVYNTSTLCAGTLEHTARLGWGKNLMKFSDYVSDPLSEWASEVDDRTLANPPQTLCNALLWWFWIWGSIIALTTVKMTKRHFVWSSLCGDCVRQLSVGIPRHSTSGRSAVPHRGHTVPHRGHTVPHRGHTVPHDGMNPPENSPSWQVTQFSMATSHPIYWQAGCSLSLTHTWISSNYGISRLLRAYLDRIFGHFNLTCEGKYNFWRFLPNSLKSLHRNRHLRIMRQFSQDRLCAPWAGGW